ncbi:hypothetical protein D3C86_1454300 [compost metagenome]
MGVALVGGDAFHCLAEDHRGGDVVEKRREQCRQGAGGPEHAFGAQAPAHQVAVERGEHVPLVEQLDHHLHERHEGDQAEQFFLGLALRVEEVLHAVGVVDGVVDADDDQTGHHEHGRLEFIHLQLCFKNDKRHAKQEYRQHEQACEREGFYDHFCGGSRKEGGREGLRIRYKLYRSAWRCDTGSHGPHAI